MRLKLSKIYADERTQIRVRKLDEGYVSQIAESIRSGAGFPPVTVFRDQNGKHWLADGHHRFHGHYKAEIAEIECDIREGTLDDAIEFALRCNVGLKFTNEDKRNAVLTVLNHPVWRERSANWVAEMCGVDVKTVQSVIESTLELPKLSETVIGKDGKRRPRENSKSKASTASANGKPKPTESRLILPITSQQIEQISAIMRTLPSEEAIDEVLAPYGVSDWDELNRDQASELIASLVPTQPNTVSVEEPTITPQPIEDSVTITIQGNAEDKWKVARLTLTGQLALQWQRLVESLRRIEEMERRFTQEVTAVCQIVGFDLDSDFEYKSSRYEYKHAGFHKLKKHYPASPCPQCLEIPASTCPLCRGTKIVSSRTWSQGLVTASQKLVLIEALGGKIVK